ncbi:hypothetical protein EfmAA242_21070 [Enterococcus faecium]|nr:hypothetical protein EfmAA242_21070 [Enterococcus faecium]
MEVKAREFNHISIDKDRSILRKISEDVEKFIGEIKWYLKLPAQVEYVRPRIFEYSTSVQDPGNVGTMIRTADAFGMAGVLLGKGTADIYSTKVLRSMQGSNYHLPVLQKDLAEVIPDMYLDKTFQRFNKLRKDPRFTEFFSSDIQINGVMGNEGQGVSQEILSSADQNVYIPMKGNAESLNVGVAAGIVLYHFSL